MIDYKKFIPEIEGFPVEGISFKDITPLLANAEAFSSITNEIANFAKEHGATVIAGPESRGFIFGCPVATKLGIGFVPVRKPGKLPREFVSEDYGLEYGTETLCMHADAVKKGDKVVIVDDLLATGGTAKAAIKLCEKLGAEVVGLCFAIKLTDLEGWKKFEGYPYKTFIEFDH